LSNTALDLNVINQGTSSAVPEPSTWALLLSGFGALGVAGWRRSRRALPALTHA